MSKAIRGMTTSTTAAAAAAVATTQAPAAAVMGTTAVMVIILADFCHCIFLIYRPVIAASVNGLWGWRWRCGR